VVTISDWTYQWDSLKTTPLPTVSGGKGVKTAIEPVNVCTYNDSMKGLKAR